MQPAGLLVALALFGQVPEVDTTAPGEPLGAPAVPDTSPTSWSCTVETLKGGTDCFFESEAKPASDAAEQGDLNRKAAEQLGAGLCADAARAPHQSKPDAAMLELCKRDFALAADGCGVDSPWPLLDAKGRFAPSARACYRALATTLQKTSLTAVLASKCCQCVKRSGCPGAGERCYRALARAKPDPASASCMAKSCEEECGMVLSTPDERQAESPDGSDAEMRPATRRQAHRL